MIYKLTPFYLQRDEDESGISGTGVVLVGVILPSGECAVEWCTFNSSFGLYDNLAEIQAIHGHGGKTRIIMGHPPHAIDREIFDIAPVSKPAKKPVKRKKKVDDEQG